MNNLPDGIKQLGVTELSLFALMLALGLLAWNSGYGRDEVEHMHVAFLITRGLQPRDR